MSLALIFRAWLTNLLISIVTSNGAPNVSPPTFRNPKRGQCAPRTRCRSLYSGLVGSTCKPPVSPCLAVLCVWVAGCSSTALWSWWSSFSAAGGPIACYCQWDEESKQSRKSAPAFPLGCRWGRGQCLSYRQSILCLCTSRSIRVDLPSLNPRLRFLVPREMHYYRTL